MFLSFTAPVGLLDIFLKALTFGSCCSCVPLEAGWDGNQPVREDSSLSGTGGGEEASLGAGEGLPEEESEGERGGAEGRKQGEEARLRRSLVH